MRILKFVSYAALVIFLLTTLLDISLPFRFPNSTIAWPIILSTDVLLASLCGLLFLLPKVKSDILSKIMAGLVVLSVAFAILKWAPWIFTAIFLASLLVIFFSFLRYSRK
jgi:Na+/H+-translocating membrane pyrophosphatase